jgi:hypothetical protein
MIRFIRVDLVFPTGSWGLKLILSLLIKSSQVPHPMHRVGVIHKARFEPTHGSTIKVRENKEDLFPIVEECMWTVSKVEITSNQKTVEFPQV